MLKDVMQDVRISLRVLLKSPGFTVVAVLSLAVGIGVTTVMFSIVNGVLLQQLPFRDSDRLVSLFGERRDAGYSKFGLSTAEFVRIREGSQSFSRLEGYVGAFYANYFATRDPENPRRFRIAGVTPDLFSMLGYQPILGRGFLERGTPTLDRIDNVPREVIFSYGMWQSYFGGDPNVVNTTVTLSGFPITVVGIMPREFQLPTDLVDDAKFEVFYPLYLNGAELNWSNHYMTAVGVLRPGKQLSELQAEMGVLFSRLRRERPDAYPAGTTSSLRVIPLRDDLVGNVRLTLLLLMGAVGLVLLIACANVANLLLARANARQKEMALRAVLGAGRRRLVSQLLTEALLLAFVAAAGGLLLAHWCLRLTLALNPVGAIPRASEIGLDWQVLAFTLLISFAASLLFGLAPALQASRIDLNEALRVEGRSATAGGLRQRFRSALVVGEVALAFVLVIGAGLLLRSFGNLLQADLGFDPHNVVTGRVSLRNIVQYQSAAKASAFYTSFRERMQSLPGVSAAGAINAVPLSGRSSWDTMFDIEGRPTVRENSTASGASFPHLNLNVVVPGYFETMSMRLLRGRFFADTDREDHPLVAIVNETLMRRFFSGEDPLRKRVSLYLDVEKKTPWIEIVGVVADNKIGGLDEEPEQEFFIPAGQLEQLSGFSVVAMSLLVKANAGLSATEFRSVIKEIDPLLAVNDVEPVDKYVSRVLARPRFILTLIGAFAVVAFLLAAVGVYGLISYSVTQRTREIGIRMALGAQNGNILRLIVGQGSVLALIGIGIGLAASFALMRVISSLLYGVSATDPVTFVLVTLLLIVVAALASYLPARRAARVDPMLALRTE